MSSLPLGGEFNKFAANNHGLSSRADPSNCASTSYFSAPRRYLAVYMLKLFARGYLTNACPRELIVSGGSSAVRETEKSFAVEL